MTLRIGTRGSALALAQSRGIADALERVTGEAPELVIVETEGDRDQSSALPSFGGAGAFTTAIDEQQRAGRFEVSVHSLKDLPTSGREGLLLAAVPRRGPVEDCLVTHSREGLDGLAPACVVGTGSPRRRAQLLRLRPDLVIVGIRGNVETRLRRVREGGVAATLLARAGLVRLGREDEIAQVLTPQEMVPAAGQGALAVVVRDGAGDALAAVAELDDGHARAAVETERAVLAALGGGCHLPMGVLAEIADGGLRVHARVVSGDGATTIEIFKEGTPGDAARLGAEVGRLLREEGAQELLA